MHTYMGIRSVSPVVIGSVSPPGHELMGLSPKLMRKKQLATPSATTATRCSWGRQAFSNCLANAKFLGMRNFAWSIPSMVRTWCLVPNKMVATYNGTNPHQSPAPPPPVRMCGP